MYNRGSKPQWLIYVLMLLFTQMCSAKIPTLPKKKKVIIFTCKGGYGHLAASNTLTSLLSSKYDITVINPLEELLAELDIVRSVSKKSYDGEKLYNTMLKNRWTTALNLSVGYIAPILCSMNKSRMQRRFYRYLQKEKPDLVISVIPFINDPGHKAAQRLKIPYLLVTTDIDLTNWVIGVDKINYDNFQVTIAFDNKYSKRKLTSCNIKEDKIHTIGFPIRQDFLQKKDLTQIRREWDIPANKFTIMILMGGAGATATYTYARKLAKYNGEAHIIACVGRNEFAKKRLVGLQDRFKNTSITIVPFTKKISDLMSVSDLLITKPGPGSIYEALNMNLPMIIDHTTSPVYWERACIKLVSRNKWGIPLKYMKDLPGLVNKIMQDKGYYQKVKKSLVTYKKNDFNQKIKSIVDNMINQQSTNRLYCQKQSLRRLY